MHYTANIILSKYFSKCYSYPDPRPHRTFANIRYALYEYWLRNYDLRSYILILDFRDTFFQGNPFQTFGVFASRIPKYDLFLYAENFKVWIFIPWSFYYFQMKCGLMNANSALCIFFQKVKNIGICVYNSLWIGRCFGKVN